MTEVAGRSAWCDSAQSIIVLPVASYGTKIQEFEKPSFFVCFTCGAAVILTGLRTAWRTRFATRSACRKVDRPPAEMPVSTNLHEARGTRHRRWGMGVGAGAVWGSPPQSRRRVERAPFLERTVCCLYRICVALISPGSPLLMKEAPEAERG